MLRNLAEGLAPGLISKVIVQTIRSILNDSLKDIRPGQVVQAIRGNLSLWEMAGTDMTFLAGKIPPSLIAAGRPMYRKAVSDCGNATELVLSWLKEDNSVIYSLIINTPGGRGWFDYQVKEVCGKLNLEYEVGG